MSGREHGAPEESVTFSTKELLVEIRQDVRGVKDLLALKADRDRVHNVENTVAAIQLNLARHELDRYREKVDRLESGFQKAWGAWGIIGVLYGGLILKILFG